MPLLVRGVEAVSVSATKKVSAGREGFITSPGGGRARDAADERAARCCRNEPYLTTKM